MKVRKNKKLKTTGERQAFVKKQTQGSEPTISDSNYRLDLLHYLNYHNAYTDISVIRKWALKFVQKEHKKISGGLNKATDFELRLVGLLGHAKLNDYYLAEEHLFKLDTEVKTLCKKYTIAKEETAEAVAKPVVSVQDRVQALARLHLTEVEGAIDDYLTTGKDFSLKTYLTANNVSGAVAKEIANGLLPRYRELDELLTGKDDQLKEGYSFLGKVKQKRFFAFVEGMLNDCKQREQAAKTERKPRARKAKPPTVIAAKLKYLKEFPTLRLTSEKPADIIGASEAWLYDTEKRKLVCYRATDDDKLTIKGTTILNFDVKNSVSKTLRKPEEFFKTKFNKKSLNTAFKGIKSKPQTLNGRTNDRLIIYAIF
jgi:hypothetical protein